jgi:hypothetical protein
MITRQDILKALNDKLQPVTYVHAMWEAGAASFNRVDEWSDIDLQILADDERVDDVFPLVETALESLSPIELRFELARPTWHGHAQTFYRLKNASPFLLIDLVVMKMSSTERFLEPEIHGPALVHFDKAHAVYPPAWDAEAFRGRLRSYLATLRVKFELFQTESIKEMKRGNHIEALAFYQAYTLRPLLEVLGMLYRPSRYNFGTRYIYYEFPSAVVKELEGLYFIASPGDLPGKREKAEKWFWETVSRLEENLV